MKINWGTGIFLVLVVFVLSMAVLVIIANNHEVNLVTPDYYPKGISYQDQIEKEKRTNQLADGLSFTQDKESVSISFPEFYGDKKFSGDIKGKILFFYPVSYRYDKNFKINLTDSLSQKITKDSIMKGRCIIKVDWTIDSLGYYQEQELRIK